MELNRLKWLKAVRLTSRPFLDMKRNHLDDLISTNAHLPEQGTAEWLAIRRFNIGGSEMATVTGEGGFSNIKKLISNKVGLTHFSGRLATRWGKMFENITTVLMEDLLDIDGKIQETSSLQGAVKYQRYSPDGLAVVKLLCGDTINGEYLERHEYLTILFEFKSPFSSIPNGKIAKYYSPQVKAGLCSIPIADCALFVNNMYRKCKLSDLGNNNSYDKYFHDRDKVSVNLPIAVGLILVYFKKETREKFLRRYDNSADSDSDSNSDTESDSDNESYSDEEFDYDLHAGYQKSDHQKLIESLSKNESTRDYGKAQYHEFNALMQLFDDGLIDMHYCKPLIVQNNIHQIEFLQSQTEIQPQDFETDLENYKSQLGEFSKKENMVGYIPYKLFKSDIIVEHRDPSYLQRNEDKICAVIEKVKKIVGEDHTDLESIYERFRKEFPNKSDWVDREIEHTMDEYRNSQSYADMVPDF